MFHVEQGRGEEDVAERCSLEAPQSLRDSSPSGERARPEALHFSQNLTVIAEAFTHRGKVARSAG